MLRFALLRYFALFVVFCLFASTSGARELRYTVDLRHPETHRVRVTLSPIGYRSNTFTFQMPAWAPGAYSLTEYGRYVDSLQAFDAKGRLLTVKRVDYDRWSVAKAKSLKEIRYFVRDSHSDSTSLYFGMANFDTSLVYAATASLFGYVDDDKSSPATITYLKPDAWQLVTALPPSKKGYAADTSTAFRNTTFYAKNYDVLIDAPLMAAPEFQARSFKSGSTVYDIALVSQGPFAMDSLEKYTHAIVDAETDFFHDRPFDHYTFIIYSPTMSHVTTFAQGALEHANSSNYLLVNVAWGLFKESFLSVLSHEFFHAWDVKRIHSNLLGPFDYTKRVETTSLWMAEGVTDYYAHALLSRYGIVSPERFYQDINTWQRTLQHISPKEKSTSLEQLSIDESDFHIESAMLFYIKGPLVAWALDLEIRHQTANKRSLDDVMRALNADAQKGKSFSDQELIGLVEKYSGASLHDFYQHYIAGTDSLPIDHYLQYMGLRTGTRRPSGTLTMSSDSSLVFETIDAGSPYALAQLQPGDTLIAIDGERLTLDNADLFVTARHEGRAINLTFARNGERKTVRLDFGAVKNAHQVGPYEVDPSSTTLEDNIRKSIAGDA